jgi:hypothetical protein
MSDKEHKPDAGQSAPSPRKGGGTGGGDKAFSAVSDLMEERRRFEAWLAALEARRDSTPERVYVRVHADYTTRLEAVIDQLTSHTDGLRGELGRLTSQIASVAEAQQQAREERSEGELRSHVGEITAEKWEELSRTSDAHIAELSARHALLQKELVRARELLTDAERPVTTGSAMAAIPATPNPGGAAAAKAAAVGDSAEGAVHVPAAQAPPGARPKGRTGSFDELAFLSSVVDTEGGAAEGSEAPAATAPPAAKPAERAPEPAAARIPPPDRIVEGPADRPTASPSQERTSEREPARRDSYAIRAPGAKIENLDGAPSALGAPPRGRGETPMAANISGNNPIVIKDKPQQGAKTLKCADCGAMNFPTEWYCERCGAELASL